jgi:hypothetical protein
VLLPLWHNRFCATTKSAHKLLNPTDQTDSVEVRGQSGDVPKMSPGENRKLSCDGSDIRAPGIGASDLAECLNRRAVRRRRRGHAIMAVYTTLDDSSEVWDIIPMMEFLLENTTDPNRISFLVTGVYKFRVGVRRSGSTDTITSADLSLRKDGVNA